MIIDKIKIECIAFLKPKDNTPVSTHGHAPKPFQFPLQRMQSPAWEQSNFVRVRCLIDCQQNVGDFLHHGRRKTPPVAAFV
jgi:hypothetical protein